MMLSLTHRSPPLCSSLSPPLVLNCLLLLPPVEETYIIKAKVYEYLFLYVCYFFMLKKIYKFLIRIGIKVADLLD